MNPNPSRNELVYSSRSKLESFLDCPRYGYLKNLWDNRGLTKRGASVYLSTGTYTHIGLAHVMQAAKDHKDISPLSEVVDIAVELSTNAYRAEIERRGFVLEEGEDKANESYIIDEQCALVEAFVRSFCYKILPDLLERFHIIDIEREEVVHERNSVLVQQAKIDVVMEEKADGDKYIISYKTAAQWDRRQEKANEHDTQGLSETWALEYRLREENYWIDSLTVACNFEGVDDANSVDPKIKSAASKFIAYLDKLRKNEKVMGVIMIYFLKGKRYEGDVKGRWEQHSELIRGYRKLIGTEYEYADSLYFRSEKNKSGWGRLGKGWESFNVWEDEQVGGVKGWLQMKAEGKLGPDSFAKSFKVPAPYFRNQGHIDSWVRQAKAQEQEILDKTRAIEKGLVQHVPLLDLLDSYFVQRRRNCHYPTDCEMLDMCYVNEVFNDPIGSGRFVYRTPHHDAELEAHEKLYQISKQAVSRVKVDARSTIKAEKEDREIVDSQTAPSQSAQATSQDLNVLNSGAGVSDPDLDDIVIDV